MGITFTATIACNVCGHTADCVVEVTHKGKVRPVRVPGQPGWQYRYGWGPDSVSSLSEDTIIVHCPDHRVEDGSSALLD